MNEEATEASGYPKESTATTNISDPHVLSHRQLQHSVHRPGLITLVIPCLQIIHLCAGIAHDKVYGYFTDLNARILGGGDEEVSAVVGGGEEAGSGVVGVADVGDHVAQHQPGGGRMFQHIVRQSGVETDRLVERRCNTAKPAAQLSLIFDQLC